MTFYLLFLFRFWRHEMGFLYLYVYLGAYCEHVSFVSLKMRAQDLKEMMGWKKKTQFVREIRLCHALTLRRERKRYKNRFVQEEEKLALFHGVY